MNLESNYFSLNASESVFSNNNSNVRNCVQKQYDPMLTLDRGAFVARTSPLHHNDCVFVSPSNSSIVNIKSIIKAQDYKHSRMTMLKKTKPILLDHDGAENTSLRSSPAQQEPEQEPFDSPTVQQRQLAVEGHEEADEKMEDNIDTTTIRYEYCGCDDADKSEAVVVAGHMSIVSTTDSEKQELSDIGVKQKNNHESISSGICDTTVASVKRQARKNCKIRNIEGTICRPTTTSQNCSTGTNRTWKKPLGKPKRPLSAYNLFFQLERKRFIGSGGVDDPHFTQDDIDSLTNTRTVKKRCNRKTHGLIAFGDLARHIGTKWKSLDKETKQLFEVRAHDEKVRYQNEIRSWLLQKAQQPIQEEESNKKAARSSGASMKETDEQHKDCCDATTTMNHSLNEDRVTSSSLLPSRFLFDVDCNIKPKIIHPHCLAGIDSYSASSAYHSTTGSQKKKDPSTTSSDCTRRLSPTTNGRKGQIQAGVTEDYDRDNKDYIDANNTTFLRWINDTTASVDDGYRITSYESTILDNHLDPGDVNLHNHQESSSFDIRATDTRDRIQSNGMESDDNRNDQFFEMYLQQQRENDTVQYHPQHPNIHYDDDDYEMESLKHCIRQQQEEMGQLHRYMHQQQQFNLFQAARAINAQSQHQQQVCPTVQDETYYDGSLCDMKNTDSIDLYHHRRGDSCFSMYMDYNYNEDGSTNEQHDDVFLQNDNDPFIQHRLVTNKKDGIDPEHNSEPFLSSSSIRNLKTDDSFHHSYNDLQSSYHRPTEQEVFSQQQEQQRHDEQRFQQKFQHRTDPNIYHTRPMYDLTDDTAAVDHHLHNHGSTITCSSSSTDNLLLQSTKRASVVNHQEEMYLHRVKKGIQVRQQLLSPSSSRSTFSQSSSMNNNSRSRTMSFPPTKFPQDVVEVTNRTTYGPGEGVSYYKNTDPKDVCHRYSSPLMVNDQHVNTMYKRQIQRQQLQQQRRRRLRMMMMMQRMSTNDDIDLCNSKTTTTARSYNNYQQQQHQHEEGEDRDLVSIAPLPPPLLLHNTTEYENQQQQHQPISVSRRMSNKLTVGRTYPDTTYLMTTNAGSSARTSTPDPNTTFQQQQQQLQLLPVDNMDGDHHPISITAAAAANENHSQQQRHEHVSTMIHENSNDSMTGYQYEYNY